MHFPKILEKKKCGPDRLREIFTSKCPEKLRGDETDEEKEAHSRQTKNHEIRKRFESRSWDRILQGVETNARNARIPQAIDMAMASSPIEKEMVPLNMFAQGRLKREHLFSTLTQGIGPEAAKRFIKKDPGSNRIDIDLPRITETNINITHSYVTRRLAAMDSLWANLWPLYKFDPRGKSQVALCRADVVSQKVDMISDQYGWRNFGSQCRRDMLLYGRSLAFPRCAWDKKIKWRFTDTDKPSDEDKIESYVEKEGLDLVNPHFSRTFYDFSAPLSGINTDTGPTWVGYWDIVRYGTLVDSSSNYFNVDDIVANDQWTGLAGQYLDFFSYYFDPCTLTFPSCDQVTNRWNERASRIGRYTAQQRDMGMLLTQYFERINPKTEGIGEYDVDIWIRLVVGGAGTIIGAEFMPSIPCAFGGINQNDNVMLNQSMASQLLVYQDMLTNIHTQMYEQLRLSFVQLWLLDKDSLEPDILEEFKKNAKNKTFWIDPKVLIYSATKLHEMGIADPKTAFTVIQANITNTVSTALTAMSQVLNLCDRLQILSPNELGQATQHEVAAREVQEMSTSVQAMYSFINQGPRQQNSGIKKMTYESLVTNGEPNLAVPVLRMYTEETIKAAGFTVDKTEVKNGIVPAETVVRGPLKNIIYDYYFDSREGSERQADTQAAAALTQLLQVLLQTPGVGNKLGLDRILDIVNTIIRMSGAPIDMQVEKNDGESDDIPQDQAQPAQPGQPPPQGAPAAPAGPQLPPQVVELLNQQNQRIAKLEAMIGGQAPAGAAQPPPAPSSPASRMVMAA